MAEVIQIMKYLMSGHGDIDPGRGEPRKLRALSST